VLAASADARGEASTDCIDNVDTKTMVFPVRLESSVRSSRLSPWCVDYEREHSRVVCKIRIRWKDGPLAFHHHSAQKDICDRNCNSFSPAFITSLGRLFVIGCVNRLIGKGAKMEYVRAGCLAASIIVWPGVVAST
jgi:hypothetical protein